MSWCPFGDNVSRREIGGNEVEEEEAEVPGEDGGVNERFCDFIYEARHVELLCRFRSWEALKGGNK